MEACEGGDKPEQTANDQLQPIESKITTSGKLIFSLVVFLIKFGIILHIDNY